MEKSEFYGLPNVEEVLNTNCTEVLQNYSYSVPLEKGEIEIKNDEINQALAELARLKEERSQLTALAKIQNAKIQENHTDVMSGSKQYLGTVYKILNPTGIMDIINHEGLIISSSRVKQAQMNMFRNQSEQKEAM